MNAGDQFIVELIPPIAGAYFANNALYEPGTLCLKGGGEPFPNNDAGFITWMLEDADPQPELTVDGTCPGLFTIDVAGASPEGRVALIFGRREGSTVIPPNFECAGVQLGVAGSVQIATTATADLNGNVQIQRNAPAAACGGFLQVIDVTSCATSNVEQVN